MNHKIRIWSVGYINLPKRPDRAIRSIRVLPMCTLRDSWSDGCQCGPAGQDHLVPGLARMPSTCTKIVQVYHWDATEEVCCLMQTKQWPGDVMAGQVKCACEWQASWNLEAQSKKCKANPCSWLPTSHLASVYTPMLISGRSKPRKGVLHPSHVHAYSYMKPETTFFLSIIPNTRVSV